VACNHWKYINAQIDEGICRYGPDLLSRPAFARYLRLRSANDGTAFDIVGVQSRRRHHADMVARLNSFPANRFVLRSKQGRPYYIYADPSGCGCAYVGTVAAMDKYRASFGALPADTLSTGGFTNPEQNMIDSMEQDDGGAQFNRMYLVRISRGVRAALPMKPQQASWALGRSNQV